MTDFNQYNLRSNIDGQLNENVSLSLDLEGRVEDRAYPTEDLRAIYENTISSYPTERAQWPNGQITPNAKETYHNPLIAATDAGGYDKQQYYVLNSKLNLTVNIPWIEGLSIQGNAAIDHDFNHNKNFSHNYTVYALLDGENHTTTPVKVGPADPRLSESYSNSRRTFFNAQAIYNKSIGLHNFNLMAGAEQRKASGSDLGAYRRYFLGTAIDYMFAGGDDSKDNWGSGWINVSRNYFGRLDYNFMEKYLLQLNMRYDGSEKFPKDKRFGFFPGIQMGWRISEESFWEGAKPVINYMKVRASWGKMGNDRIDNFMYLSGYAYEGNKMYIGGKVYNPLEETISPNPHVTWETENSYNLGIDMHLFQDIILLETDLFFKHRNDILIARSESFPLYTGLSLPPENIGEVKNKGIEAVITYQSSLNKEFNFSVSLNGTFVRNSVINWDEAASVPDHQKAEGKPMFTALYYEAIGIFDNEEQINKTPHWAGAKPGDIIFKDFNEDGLINSKDRVRQDLSDIPELMFGANVSMNYKNIDLSMLWQGAGRVMKYNQPVVGAIGNMYADIANDHWTETNKDAYWPRAWDRESMYWTAWEGANTFFFEKGNYLRLKNIELGYTLPERLTSTLLIKKARFYVSAQNILTFHTLHFYDPEANTGNYVSYYPIMKVINFGATLRF